MYNSAYLKACWQIIVIIFVGMSISTAFIDDFSTHHYYLSFEKDGLQNASESCVIPAAQDTPIYVDSFQSSFDPINNYPWLICNDIRNSTGYIKPALKKKRRNEGSLSSDYSNDESSDYSNDESSDDDTVSICKNTCTNAYDGDCDDGGANSDYGTCELGTDCSDCGNRYKNRLDSGEDTVSICKNTCTNAYDGDCDDGGANSDYGTCELGTDCSDCGNRYKNRRRNRRMKGIVSKRNLPSSQNNDDNNDNNDNNNSDDDNVEPGWEVDYNGAWTTDLGYEKDGEKVPIYSFCPRNYDCVSGDYFWNKYGFSDYSSPDTVFCIHNSIECGNSKWCGQLRLDSAECRSCENCPCSWAFPTIATFVYIAGVLGSCGCCLSFVALKPGFEEDTHVMLGMGGKVCNCLDWAFDIIIIFLILVNGIGLYFETYEKSDCLGPDAEIALRYAKEEAEKFTFNIATLGGLEFISVLIAIADCFL
jgi:hypothetical protein